MQTRIYYLRSDRSVTDNRDDTERVDGTAKTIFIEAETEEEMYQEMLNEFRANSYNHSVTVKILTDSKLFDKKDLYVGRMCRILSEKAGIRETMITSVIRKDEYCIQVTFGKLPVKLTGKLRREA